MKIPKEAMDYYEVFGLTEEDLVELHRKRVLSIKTLAETMAELEALIKKGFRTSRLRNTALITFCP